MMKRLDALARTPRALVMAMVLLLVGCGGTVPEARIYVIDATYDAAEATGAPIAETLQIPPFASTDVYSDRRIAWREASEPFRVRLMDNDLWSSAPANLLQQELLQCLRRSGLYQNVVPSGVAVRIDQVLQGRVKRFGFTGVEASLKEFVMEVDLMLTGREPRRLIWQGGFRHDENLQGDDSAAAIEAVVAGFQELCRRTRAILGGLRAGDGGG
jgi:ABC-type uncharacterized transport system auxiliary subunit